MIIEYPKIDAIFCRNLETKKIEEGNYRDKAFEYLKNIDWEFTEKIDGTNIRIYWDGHKISFYGRTDRAQIPQHLANYLINKFSGNAMEEIFEQEFGEKEVILFGEGYGAKIQNGGDYIQNGVSFALFDVYVNETWLNGDSVYEIADKLNIETVPILFKGKLQEGVAFVKTFPMSTIGNAKMEGVVARPLLELQNNNGKRIITKIKVVDFK